MTTIYSRSQLYSYDDLTDEQQTQVMDDYCFELSDCHSTQYVILKGRNVNLYVKSIEIALPLSMFMRTNKNNFTHGIFSSSAFDGYFVTFDRNNEYATIAHKLF